MINIKTEPNMTSKISWSSSFHTFSYFSKNP